MKRFGVLLGVMLFLVGLAVALSGTVGAYPGGGTVDQCLACHDDPIGSANATAVFRAAHDGLLGECQSCHRVAGETMHGEWGDTTAACSRCHRTHTAAADGLLIMEEDALCEFCHGVAAGLANTNVLEGLQRHNGGSLRAGGFDSAVMNTDANQPVADADPEINDDWNWPVSGAVSNSATSTHTLGVEALLWGSGPIANETAPSAGETSTILRCVSCHDPHAFNQTYRMLKPQPAASAYDYHGSTEYAFVTDQLAYAKVNADSGVLSYETPDYTQVDYASPDVYKWDAGNSTWVLMEVTCESYGLTDTVPKHSQQLSQWCATCHER